MLTDDSLEEIREWVGSGVSLPERMGRELLAEFDRLAEMETRMRRLADAYEANVVMLARIAHGPDSMLGIMAECSLSTAKMIRKSLDE